MIRRFEHIEGRYIEKITGQDRLAFALSDTTDFYDLAEWAERGGYQGSVLSFYDCKTGKVDTPFEKQKNVVYSKPRYLRGAYYFLRGDYGEQSVVLYRYAPGQKPEVVTELGMEELNLYNLELIGEDVHIVSQDDEFHCYYPERFSFPLSEHESVILMENGKIYCESWVEEGWDKERGCQGEQYKYYDKLIVRNFEGTILSEEVGSLYRNENGDWWIA